MNPYLHRFTPMRYCERKNDRCVRCYISMKLAVSQRREDPVINSLTCTLDGMD